MKIDVQALPIKNNPVENRFEVELEGKRGEIVYRKEGSTYIMVHTEVPREFGGQGVAEHLVHGALEQIKAANETVVPVCPFVRAYIRRHPEYQPLVVHGPTMRP